LRVATANIDFINASCTIQPAPVAEAIMNKPVRPVIAGTAHITAAWVFLIGAIIAGIVGVYRMMSAGGTDAIAGAAANAGMLAQQGAGCMCLGALLGIIAAVLALLGIHKQLTAMAFVGPSFQGSHGSGDDTT
jgi:hypothetical protein